MMQRRGFLGAMLAAMAAPAVMTSAIERGILMPVQPKIWTPSENVIESSVYDGPMLRLFSAGGIMLASIPLTKQQQAMFDYGRKVSMDFSGAGNVIATGMAARYELDISPTLRQKGMVGQGGGLQLSSEALVVGQDVTIPSMTVGGNERHFHELIDRDDD